MFKEVSKMEQRYDAVLMVIKDGYAVSEVNPQPYREAPGMVWRHIVKSQ